MTIERVHGSFHLLTMVRFALSVIICEIIVVEMRMTLTLILTLTLTLTLGMIQDEM